MPWCDKAVGLISLVLTALVVFLTHHPETCSAQQLWQPWYSGNTWSPWIKPWDNFDRYVFVRTYYGDVKGFSVPMYLEDEYWREDWSEYPKWFMRRVNCFLGVPYALPPVGQLRFRRPRPPVWGGVWNATYFRPSCPQQLGEIQKEIPDFPPANISEDCLYMNIFVPNRTQPNLVPDQTRYPVVVIIHSGDFTHGSSQLLPGHVLAIRDVVVVTFNYRLGALGFLTTEDEHAQGNWGMFDQHLALEFIQQNIGNFRGDPSSITIMGDGAGAASVGMHLVSPLSVNKNFYHRAVIMSGSDMSPFAFVSPFWQPRQYAFDLAQRVGCSNEDTYLMMSCLRNNATVPWQAILDAQKDINPIDGTLGIVWGPTQDGGYRGIDAFMPQTPTDMRRQGKFAEVPMIIGLNAQDGARKANESVRDLKNGIDKERFKGFVDEVLEDWKVIDIYRARAFEAMEFQYTYWPDPDNTSARGQEFINMMTDLEYGVGMNYLIRQHSASGKEPVWMYVFDYKSWSDWLPYWMGVSHSAAVPYVLGFPFLNESILNETELVPRQWYDYEDRNMSDWMMYMWSNFAIYGEPTPNITRNVTWDPFNPYNLTYLKIDFHSHNWYRYRQAFYGFWDDYFPTIAKQDYLYPTATPTPAGFEYVVSTGSLSSLMIILLCAIALLCYLLWRQNQTVDDLDERMEETPLSFMKGRSTDVEPGPSAARAYFSGQSSGPRSQGYSTPTRRPSEEMTLEMSGKQSGSVSSMGTSVSGRKAPYSYPQHSVV